MSRHSSTNHSTGPATRPEPVSCTQLIARFDRNGEREIGLPLLRRVRTQIRRDMRAAGAHGSMVWRLARTPSGITVSALWYSRREAMIDVSRAVRAERLERRERLAREGVVNRRRVGTLTVPHQAARKEHAQNTGTAAA